MVRDGGEAWKKFSELSSGVEGQETEAKRVGGNA